MNTQGFDYFLEERGLEKLFHKPAQEEIEKYVSRLPEYMLEIWSKAGFFSSGKGLFRFSEPKMFDSILEVYFGSENSYAVFCHSSFGDLLIWDSGQPSIISLNAASGQGVRMAKNGEIDSFFTFTMTDDDFFKIHRFEMHLKAVEKFGQLEEDQVFGFFPALSMGGEEKLENIKVVQIREYLAMLAEIAVEQNREIAARDA